MALFMDVGPNDVLQIGDVQVMVDHKTGSRARLRVLNAPDVKLLRNERLKPEPNPQRISAANPEHHRNG